MRHLLTWSVYRADPHTSNSYDVPLCSRKKLPYRRENWTKTEHNLRTSHGPVSSLSQHPRPPCSRTLMFSVTSRTEVQTGGSQRKQLRRWTTNGLTPTRSVVLLINNINKLDLLTDDVYHPRRLHEWGGAREFCPSTRWSGVDVHILGYSCRVVHLAIWNWVSRVKRGIVVSISMVWRWRSTRTDMFTLLPEPTSAWTQT